MLTNLNRWAMSQKLPVNGFKWKKNMLKFSEDLVKNYDENRDKEYIFEVDVKYPKNLLNLYGDLLFLPKRKKKKCYKLVCNIHDKENYAIHIML